MSDPRGQLPEPRRRSDEYRRWNDERLDDLAQIVRGFSPVVTMVATHAAQIDAIRDDLAELRTTQADEARAAAAFRREYREDRETDRKQRDTELGARRADNLKAVVTICAAFIAASGTIAAAAVAVFS